MLSLSNDVPRCEVGSCRLASDLDFGISRGSDIVASSGGSAALI